MLRKDFVRLLSDIEKSIPVSEWKYADMYIWPIIKKDIFFKWLPKDVKNNTPVKQNNKPAKKLIQVLTSFRYYVKLKLQKNKAVNAIFIGAAAHRVDYDSMFINRYFYPLIKDNNQDSFFQFEYGAERDGKNYNAPQKTLFVKNLIPAFLMLNVFNKHDINIPQWDKFVSEIESQAQLSLKKYSGNLKGHLHSIYSIAQAYQFLFKKYKPDKILSLCYYKNETLAMHYAANKLNIENIDVQHGAQGPLHVMYNFSNPPIGGYNTVPHIFWCWDKASANTLKEWTEKQQYHKVVVKGNPWISFQMSQINDNEPLSSDKVVLYTLQEVYLDEYIIDAIEKTKKEFTWWLRLHPRMQAGRQHIEEQLRQRNLIGNVEIAKANSMSLPVLLKKCDVHISKYSGSIIEAAQIGTPNIIIHEVGVETYQEYVANGNAETVVSGNADELVAIIKKLVSTKK